MPPAVVIQKNVRIGGIVYKHLKRMVKDAEIAGASAPEILELLASVIPQVQKEVAKTSA